MFLYLSCFGLSFFQRRLEQQVAKEYWTTFTDHTNLHVLSMERRRPSRNVEISVCVEFEVIVIASHPNLQNGQSRILAVSGEAISKLVLPKRTDDNAKLVSRGHSVGVLVFEIVGLFSEGRTLRTASRSATQPNR